MSVKFIVHQQWGSAKRILTASIAGRSYGAAFQADRSFAETSFAPSGLVPASALYPRLAPWAALFRRFAALLGAGFRLRFEVTFTASAGVGLLRLGSGRALTAGPTSGFSLGIVFESFPQFESLPTKPDSRGRLSPHEPTTAMQWGG
jgi:hypothetical protein